MPGLAPIGVGPQSRAEAHARHGMRMHRDEGDHALSDR